MQRSGLAYIHRLPEIAALLEHADHVDVKTVSGSVDMRTFVANMFSYQPSWVAALFGVRAVFVRLLGMRQQRKPRTRNSRHLQPENIPMQAGQPISFFKVRMAEEELYWIAEAKDTHLNALLGVVVEPLPEQQKRFHVVTVVYYHNWTGPVYFNVIRPFHHVVVGSMAIAGARNHVPNPV